MNPATRRRLLVIIIAAATIAATVYGFLPKPVDVDLVRVSRGPLQVVIEEEGRTRLKDRFVISATTSGYLRRIPMKAGDPVKKSQTVAVLEPLRSQALDPRTHSEATAMMEAARASLKAAEARERATSADAEYLRQRFDRMQNLYNRGSLAKDQMDQTTAEFEKSRAAQLASRAAVEAARSDLAKVSATLKNVTGPRKAEGRDTIVITAPVDGSVVKLYRESEGSVHAGEPLMEIGNPQGLEVRVEILSADAVKIRKGTPVLFSRWGGDGLLSGIVRVVEPGGFTKISSLGVEEQRVLVIVDITTPYAVWQALGDAYRLEAAFVIWEGKDVLQIPATALFRSGTGWAVYVEENGRARQRKVEIGQRARLNVQILSGLKADERIVVHPDEAVRDNVKIRDRGK